MGVFDFLKTKGEWDLIGTTSTNPQQLSPIALLHIPEKVLQKLLLGITTFVWQNSETKKIKTEEILGIEQPLLKNLLDAVDLHGKYDFVNGDKKYMIIKMESTPAPPTTSQLDTIDITQLPVKKA